MTLSNVHRTREHESQNIAPPRPYFLAVFNQKGGISKTTTVVSMSIALSSLGYKVLVIDLDSQGDATRNLYGSRASTKCASELLESKSSVRNVICPTFFPNIDIVPSTSKMIGIEFSLSGRLNSQRSLHYSFDSSQLNYNFILMDCPPALGIVPINALAIADGVLVPITPSIYATDALIRTFQSIDYVKNGINNRLSIDGILLCIYQRSVISRKIERDVREKLGDAVYQKTIPHDENAIDSSTFGIPLLLYRPSSPAANAYFDFTCEFLNRYEKRAARLGYFNFQRPSISISGARKNLMDLSNKGLFRLPHDKITRKNISKVNPINQRTGENSATIARLRDKLTILFIEFPFLLRCCTIAIILIAFFCVIALAGYEFSFISSQIDEIWKSVKLF